MTYRNSQSKGTRVVQQSQQVKRRRVLQQRRFRPFGFLLDSADAEYKRVVRLLDQLKRLAHKISNQVK